MLSVQLFPACFHPGEQIHGALLLQQEVLVHDEERLHLPRGLRLLHHPEQFFAGLVEVEHLAFAAEERRGGAEVAAHGAAHGSDHGGGTVDHVGDLDAHHAQVEPGGERRMTDGRFYIFAEVAAHPGDAVALDDMIGVQKVLDAGDGRDVPADDDGRMRRELPHHAAHLARFAHVHDDRGDADHVVVVPGELARERLAGGEIQNRAGRRDVLLDHHDAPGAVEAAQRKRALRPGHLVVVKLHRVDGAAAEIIVLGVRTKDGAEQYTSAGPFRVGINLLGRGSVLRALHCLSPPRFAAAGGDFEPHSDHFGGRF